MMALGQPAASLCPVQIFRDPEKVESVNSSQPTLVLFRTLSPVLQ